MNVLVIVPATLTRHEEVDGRPRGTPEMCHASRRAAASASGSTIGGEQTVPRQT